MNQERYWRNLIADEIAAEHDRVMTYYRKKGINSGGMSPEEHTRLNIFKLCESIARAMKESPDAPQEKSTPTPQKSTQENLHSDTESTQEKTVEEEIDELNSFIEEQIEEFKNKEVNEDIIRNLVKDTPRQNQFGEFL